MASPLLKRKSIFDIRLDTTRDNELIQRFVRVNVEDEGEKKERKSEYAIKAEVTASESLDREGKAKETVAKQVSEDKTSKPTSAKKPKKVKVKIQKRKVRRIRNEELYTDKDRAAAAAMGSRDIKLSLKMKRKLDKAKNLKLAEEAEPTTLMALGNYEIKRGDLEIGLDFINKALELNPSEKNALVARSRCYILLGQPDNALKDAESALAIDKNFLKGIYQKAESLYFLGDFEHSLMYYHRGLHLRPDHEGFKLGVHKAQKAIENAIGFCPWSKNKNTTPKSSKVTTSREKNHSPVETTNNEIISKTPTTTATRQSNRTTSSKKQKKSKILRQLAPDKDYLDNLLENPNIRCKFKDNDDGIISSIKEAVQFLNTREEFWRQQLPTNTR